jgi:2-amino-4-hydroxy-6-hydroxymethyldihydropteridine diphosphokinase
MPLNSPVRAYIALGANLGDRERSIVESLRLLAEGPKIRVTRTSSLFDNPSVGGPPGAPCFLNAAAEIETTLPATDLLNRLLAVERQLGRTRHTKWDPRVIDLDLLLYGNEVIDAPGLKVPHPLMQGRRFVLVPLAEIAPNVRHPVLNQKIAELLANLEQPARS